MIPIKVVNPVDNTYYGQIFNDNLAPVELINRKLLYAIYYAQTNLINANFDFGISSGKSQFTDEQLNTINDAASELVSSITAAVNKFNDSMKK